MMFGKSGCVCLKYKTKEGHGGTVGMVTALRTWLGRSDLGDRPDMCWHTRPGTHRGSVCTAVDSPRQTLQNELLLHMFFSRRQVGSWQLSSRIHDSGVRKGSQHIYYFIANFYGTVEYIFICRLTIINPEVSFQVRNQKIILTFIQICTDICSPFISYQSNKHLYQQALKRSWRATTYWNYSTPHTERCMIDIMCYT